MKPTPMPETDQQRRHGAELDGRYGAIGISAVAAAVRYQGDAKNPAYAPAVPQSDDRDTDAAA
jgi:hypothetical protein